MTIEQPGWNAHRAVQRHELVVVIVTFKSARHIEDCLRPLRDRKVLVRQPHFVTFAAFPLVKAVYLLKS